MAHNTTFCSASLPLTHNKQTPKNLRGRGGKPQKEKSQSKPQVEVPEIRLGCSYPLGEFKCHDDKTTIRQGDQRHYFIPPRQQE